MLTDQDSGGTPARLGDKADELHAAAALDRLRGFSPNRVAESLKRRFGHGGQVQEPRGETRFDFVSASSKVACSPGALFELLKLRFSGLLGRFGSARGYERRDDRIWARTNSEGAVMRIHCFGHDAAVVVSSCDPHRWTFTTIQAPRCGKHPVSGHREFGVIAGEDAHFVYTAGLMSDTPGDVIPARLVFVLSRAMWRGFQRNLVSGMEWTNRESVRLFRCYANLEDCSEPGDSPVRFKHVALRR